MVRLMITMIIDVVRIMKWIMTLNLWLMLLNKILEINYTYGYLTQPMAREILCRVKILFYY